MKKINVYTYREKVDSLYTLIDCKSRVWDIVGDCVKKSVDTCKSCPYSVISQATKEEVYAKPEVDDKPKVRTRYSW